MVELLAIDDNGQYTYLDLTSDVSIPYNKSIEDIEDITARKGGYTKTFNIPGSARNDKFFQSAFNVNATDFDSTLQTDCVIQYRGTDVFRGTMRLNKITNISGIINYEVYLVESLTSFSSQLEQIGICDLDFSDIEHTIDYDTIVSTWDYTGGTYSSYAGLTGKVLYPLAETGYDEDGTFGRFDFTTSGFTSPTGNPIQTTQFKPWINVKYMMDKIFERAGFTYESSFFDTQYFQSIFMLAGQSPTMGASLLEDRPDNQNFFEVEQNTPTYVYNYQELGDWKYIIFAGENYDYLDRYTLSTYPAVPGQTGAKNYFTVPIGGTYQFNFDITYWASYFASPSYIDFALRDIDTNTTLGIYSAYPVTSNERDIDLYFNVTLNKDQRVALFVKENQPSFNDVAFKNGSFRLYSSPTLSTTGATMNWVDNLPCSVDSVDFVRNIINYFNLVFVPTGEKSFLIETYNDYLSSLSGDTYDWSQKLNLDDTYTIEPLDFSLQRQLNLTFQNDDTVLGKYYIDNYDNIFGSKRYTSPNTLLSGKQDIEFIFNTLPTNTVNNSPNCDFVVPQLFVQERDSDNILQERPTSSAPRLGFFTGMKTPITGDTSSTGTSFTGITWYMQSGTTEVEWDTYPVINHLSLLTYTANTQVSDLNYTSNWDFFMAHNDMVGYTPNNAWSDFYRNPIELLYSTEARLFTGYFYLTPQDLQEITFNDKIYFLNAEWRLLEIQDGDITEPSIIKCKFLKVPYRIPSSTPIPPDYVEQAKPRTPAPTPTPSPNTLSWYFEELIGSPFANIEFEELTITEVSTGIQKMRSTALGSGSFSFASGTYNINASFTYRNNVGSLNNLQLTFGTSSGDDTYGILQIPQPADLTFYELDVNVYLPASGNLYATFDTY